MLEFKKTVLDQKNLNTKLTPGFLYGLLYTKWSIYEMVFVWKCMLKFRYHLVQKILVRSDSFTLVRNGLPWTKWSLFEMVFVRSDCQSFYSVQSRTRKSEVHRSMYIKQRRTQNREFKQTEKCKFPTTKGINLILELFKSLTLATDMVDTALNKKRRSPLPHRRQYFPHHEKW